MGEARHPPQRTPRPAHRFHLYLWRRLSKPGQGRSPHPAVLQHRGDEPAPRGNSQDRHARGPRRSIGRSGWLAPVDTPRRATKHHHYRFAAKIPRTQSGREHLAIYARQLAVKPHLQVLRRSCRSPLLRLEQARRSALENHVHRIAPVGPRVLINETWYNLSRPAERVVAFYNKRGTCEQWIKEGKGAIKWTRLSCRTFAANAVRLQLHA